MSLGGGAAEVYPRVVDAMEGIKKKEFVSIGDLHTFISNSSEQVILSL